jgi:hypothetical protein
MLLTIVNPKYDSREDLFFKFLIRNELILICNLCLELLDQSAVTIEEEFLKIDVTTITIHISLIWVRVSKDTTDFGKDGCSLVNLLVILETCDELNELDLC